MWKYALAAVLALSSFTHSYAAIVEGLYESEVIVPNQGRKARSQAMSTALAEVFSKVSGKPDAMNTPGLAEAILKPALYVQQYRYKKLQQQSRDASVRQELIWFRFDEGAINAVLRQNSVPVWGKTRPATLIWLALEDGGGRYLLGGENLLDIQDMLASEARRFGVKLIVPLLDLEDQMALRFADVWGNFQEAISNASTRYQADAILVGRAVVSRDNEWEIKWVLYENGQATTWGVQSMEVEDVISSGIIGTLEILASRFNSIFATGNEGSVRITITDVKTLQGFARVSRYLKSLEQVTNIQPSSLKVDQISFDLELRGNAQGLAQTIALGNTLRKSVAMPVNVDPNTNGGFPSQMTMTENSYRLLPK